MTIKKEQSSIEWLFEELGRNGHISNYESVKRKELFSLFEQAKELHKKEIIEAFNDSSNDRIQTLDI